MLPDSGNVDNVSMPKIIDLQSHLPILGETTLTFFRLQIYGPNENVSWFSIDPCRPFPKPFRPLDTFPSRSRYKPSKCARVWVLFLKLKLHILIRPFCNLQREMRNLELKLKVGYIFLISLLHKTPNHMVNTNIGYFTTYIQSINPSNRYSVRNFA